MTLITGIRCGDGSVLLGADREQSGHSGKRSVEKLFRIVTNQGSFLVAGAGRSSIIDNTIERLDTVLKKAGKDQNIILFDTHKDVIETVLYEIHEQYIWGHRDEASREVEFIIAAAFVSPHSIPFLYRTDEEIVQPQQLYVCAGIGRDLAYYFADKLYNDQLSREGAALITAFIFREVSKSVTGVGLGTDLWLLAEKNQVCYQTAPERVKDLEDVIPDIGNVIADAWDGKIEVPNWLNHLFT